MADCFDLLKRGVYAERNITYSTEHSTDFKHYLESDQFKNDFLNKNKGVDLEVVVNGIPIRLGYNSDETKINEFQEKIRTSTEFKINDNFFYSQAESFADESLLKTFTDCLEKTDTLGFNIKHEVSDDQITFTVKYVNFAGTGEDPILESVYISSGGKLLNQTKNIGEKLAVNSDSSFTFKLSEETNEVLFIIDTNISSKSQKVTINRKSSTYSSPIGTIISSVLNWEQFQKVTDNNKFSGGIWKSASSFWSPCDGRSISKSALENITSKSDAPDLRGVFLRGLNVIDAVSELNGTIARVGQDRKDPEDSREVGGKVQSDEFKKHSHYFVAGGGSSGPRTAISIDTNPESNHYTSDVGGSETRPKNVAIYYYIKIN